MASKRTWKAKIQNACMAAGTYREYFESVIDSLAAILEQRDLIDKDYKKRVSNQLSSTLIRMAQPIWLRIHCWCYGMT